MSLKKIFGITFAVFVVLGYGAVFFYGHFVLAGDSIYNYAFPQALLFVTVFLIIIATVFFVSIRIVGQPLLNLTNAIKAYAEKGERVPIPIPRSTPREIRMLIVAFADLVDRVEVAHKRDEEVARIRSDFITTAAHQLRTPLTGIRWALEALAVDDTLGEDQKALVQSASDKSHNLVSIVGTLLNISSIESGKYKYHFSPLDMTEFLPKVVADFQYLAKQRNVVLTYQPNESQTLVPAKADRERVKWVVDNLVENALRYTPNGGNVDVWAEMLGADMILVRVRDTGIGIAESDRANIFERFYRAGNAVAKENEGNGLGLYIARTIARDHGGDLNFAPNDGAVGTTFTLSLPVAG